ncbi:hypothetical protein F383_35107 [Gossypium arboreum]|uniref:Uncharacterized protein n=1 Tax=Gossypium arboreum TaxID=29729 RepID=A0A0B0PXF7_GOSAR|nr:hypothetical protein F383_35107 [Gossypium arboreum]
MPHGQVKRPCVRPWDTRPCNMTVCHARLRHTPVSLPMWTKIGYLPSHFSTQN